MKFVVAVAASRLLLCTAGVVLLFAAGRVSAQSVTYNFAQFDLGGPVRTPLLNIAPEIGSSAFRASFSSAPAAGGFQVADFQPNGLFSGNTLYEPFFGGNTLTITVTMPVDSLRLVFALFGPGSLNFTSTAGSVSVPATAQTGGAGFVGGTLVFANGIPFTTFTLDAGAGNTAPLFAIDDVTMNAVPEPSAYMMLTVGVGILLATRTAAVQRAARA